MKKPMFSALLLLTSLLAVSALMTATPQQNAKDVISGEWQANFTGEHNVSFDRTLKLKLDGEKVTGSFESGSTGNGTIEGTWTANKLTLTMKGQQGGMTAAALLRNGQLLGEWEVFHMMGRWKATRKSGQ